MYKFSEQNNNEDGFILDIKNCVYVILKPFIEFSIMILFNVQNTGDVFRSVLSAKVVDKNSTLVIYIW